jgi:hypothetical protein
VGHVVTCGEHGDLLLGYVVWSCQPSSYVPMWVSRILRQPWYFRQVLHAVGMGAHGRPPQLELNVPRMFPKLLPKP